MATLKETRAERYSIGEIGEQAGVNLETVRYYERIGLMPRPPRTQGGHRVYDGAHLKRLGFIRRSRELGFSLGEVRALLGLVDGGNYTCAEVRELTLAHLAEIRHKIADLRRLERSLQGMADRCTGDEVPECPVIDVLWDGIARDGGTGRSTPGAPTK
jgi:MerR family mercuric resistance operon transcriptional regulator